MCVSAAPRSSVAVRPLPLRAALPSLPALRQIVVEFGKVLVPVGCTLCRLPPPRQHYLSVTPWRGRAGWQPSAPAHAAASQRCACLCRFGALCSNLDGLGLSPKTRSVQRNLTFDEIREAETRLGEGQFTANGTFCVDTGKWRRRVFANVRVTLTLTRHRAAAQVCSRVARPRTNGW